MSILQELLGRRIKLPTVENCSECNGAYNNSDSSKRVCFDDRRPVARDHREATINGYQSMIAWGASPASTIDWGQSQCS
jgi:hypothetical protein